MAKGAEKNKTNQMLNTAQGQSQNYTNQYLSNTAPERATAKAQGNQLYGDMYGGYSDLAKTGGVTQDLINSLKSSGGGGGVAAPSMGSGMYGDVQNSYRNFMGGGGVNLANNDYAMGQLKGLSSSGGWTPDQIASQNKLISGLTDMGNTGGVDAAGQARMRGGGVYDDFAKTGGYTDADQTAFRQHATAGIPAQYQSAMDTANRMSGITGNYNPAAMAQMARNSAYDTNRGAVDAEVSLQDSIRANKMSGAQGMTNSENALQTLMSGNKLAGLQGAGSMQANMLNSIAGNRTNAATGLGNLDVAGQGLIQQGKEFGTQGLKGLADTDAANQRASASAGAASSAQNAANAKWLAQFQTGNQLAGLGGLGNLYTSNPAEVAYYDDAQRKMLGQNVSGTVDTSQARIQNNPQTNWGQVLLGAAGAAGGVMTGLGGLGVRV